MKEERVSPWVKAFVLFHLVAIASWCLPMPSEALRQGAQPRGSDYLLIGNDRYLRNSPIKWYVQATGLWQYWDMFAPNPVTRDAWMDAKVKLASGETVAYPYPRMASLSYTDKFLQERYRKGFERFNSDGAAFLWPFVARRIAEKVGPNAKQIELWRHWQDVPPPPQPVPSDYQSYKFFTYDVPPNGAMK